ncbi:MAG: LysR family transcriptional regulator [Chloroflexi bacterium]|nr:LysR family transcriptional regulator [Chloroflexota bacterium]
MVASLAPRANLWIECSGQVVLSRWRVELLQAIEDTGSISAAAQRMKVEYQRAWHKLAEMEKGLGVALVERRTGGAGGGGARLTEVGQDYVARFARFAAGVDDVIARQFDQAFGGG